MDLKKIEERLYRLFPGVKDADIARAAAVVASAMQRENERKELRRGKQISKGDGQ